MKPTIIVELVRNVPRKFPGRRPQPWRYWVKDAGNNAMYEKSSESLTNRGDTISAIEDVHGPDATVILRELGRPDRILRQPASRRIELAGDEWTRILDEVNARITNSPFTNVRVLQRVIDIINETIAPDTAVGVYDFTGVTDITPIADEIERQHGEDQS